MSTERKPHLAHVKHDAESHAFGDDCHDDCEVTIECPGVTASCRTWWECMVCVEARSEMDAEGRDEYGDRLSETSEAHGVEHQHIDGMWMTPSETCLASAVEHNADELIYKHPDGAVPVDLDCDDGFVYVLAIKPKERA